MNGEERERLLYPDVVASTQMGDYNRYMVTATTNNMDTVVKVHIYWFLPEGKDPVLMIEIDDEDLPEGEDNMDINIRVRRNDGLIYEGTQASQENIKEG
jgi:hypothetical protein